MTTQPNPAKTEEAIKTADTPKPIAEVIKLRDKWLIWIFDALEKHHTKGFKLLKIEIDEEVQNSEPISVYIFQHTSEAAALEDDWNMGRPIAIPDVHWLEDSERNFKRVVRRNRNQ